MEAHEISNSFCGKRVPDKSTMALNNFFFFKIALIHGSWVHPFSRISVIGLIDLLHSCTPRAII